MTYFRIFCCSFKGRIGKFANLRWEHGISLWNHGTPLAVYCRRFGGYDVPSLRSNLSGLDQPFLNLKGNFFSSIIKQNLKNGRIKGKHSKQIKTKTSGKICDFVWLSLTWVDYFWHRCIWWHNFLKNKAKVLLKFIIK